MPEFSQMQGVRPQVRESLNKAFEKSVEKPNKSFSACLGNGFRQTVASIFSKEKMNSKMMLSGHTLETKARAVASESKYLIAAQDTCFYNYNGHKQISGLGNISTKAKNAAKGVIQHNMLIMSAEGLHLGLIHQDYWTRDGEKDIASDEKESQKWFKGLSALNETLGEIDKKIVCVQDREADIFTFFKAERKANIELLVRVCQPRNMQILSNEKEGNLEGTAQAIKVMGEMKTIIREKNKEVELRLELRADRVDIYPYRDKSKQNKTVGLSLVVAKEVGRIETKTGKDVYNESTACYWYLLTSLPIDNEEDVKNIVKFYSLRWGIERLHYTLKSGALNVEKMQFDDIHTLINALAFYSIVAWQLIGITYLIRENPAAEATEIFKKEEVELLNKLSKTEIKSIKEAVLFLCKLTCGFAPSKQQPYPGVKTLAMAIQDFYYIKLGAGISSEFFISETPT